MIAHTQHLQKTHDKVWRRFTFPTLSTTKIRVHVTNVVGDNHSQIVEIEAYGPMNVALAANGAVASASSTFPTVVPANAINGDHIGTASHWADDTSYGYPDWLQLDFVGTKTIGEIDVFGLQQGTPVEPSLTMTSSYALSNFEVQYWTGSAWAVIPGGNVTGNDKVWRKFTFAPLSTTKIRVYVTNVIGDNHSQLVEIEAWTPGSSANLNWLVTDQLGTPRIILDESGSLGNVKRHDYLPFGEELFAGVGGRTNGQGYGGGDGVRQKFTSKERDNETGLDYFKARYYSSPLGRFVSVDPITITSYRLFNPQALNGYSYVANMPLKFTDPTGKDIQFKTQEDADRALALYQSGLNKDQQKYVSTVMNKDGTFSLKVDEKAGKAADKSSLLGRLYAATSASDVVAVVSFVKKSDTISVTVFGRDGKKVTVQTSLERVEQAGQTLLPAESRSAAIPIAIAAQVYSTETNKTQIIIATDPAVRTPTEAIFAETLVHFGEFVRTGNPSEASHRFPGINEMEEGIVKEAGQNEKTNRSNPAPKKPD